MAARKKEEEQRFQIERLRIQCDNLKAEHRARNADKEQEFNSLKEMMAEMEASHEKEMYVFSSGNKH